MTAKMKLPLKSLALQAVVEPFVMPATPDVLSIGRRCVKHGWSFWWPPWSKRPVLSPPKGKGKPLYLTVIGDIPYIIEPPDRDAAVAPAAFGPVTDGGLSSNASIGSIPGPPSECADRGGSGLGALCPPCAPADSADGAGGS